MLRFVRRQQGQDIRRKRYPAAGGLALGRLYDKPRMAFFIESLHLAFYTQKARMEVDIRPSQRTQLSQPKAAVQRQQNTKAGQVRLVHDMMCQPQDLRLGEYLHLPLLVYRQFCVQPRAEASVLGRLPQNGPQQYANVPCAFGRQALLLELPVKIRYPLLRQCV